MYWRLLQLEFKNFIRNPQFGANLGMKILMFFGMAYFSAIFVALPFILYFFAKKKMMADPLLIFCKFFIYYWAFDLIIRYFLQQMPTQNIKPFLTLGITKKKLVNYTVIKILVNFFNWGNLLFLLPFAGLLIYDGSYSVTHLIMFTIGIFAVFYFNNFLNILLNGKDLVLYIVVAVMASLAALEYFKIIELSYYSQRLFYSLYEYAGVFLVPVLLAILTAYLAYQEIYKNFYLDKGLELKIAEGKTENIAFFDRYGVMGTFINNDIRLLKRSKAAKSALFASAMFLLYGLLTFTKGYDNSFMQVFMGIFVTGGFMLMFGQRVPSWDSSYYPLMMTSNVPYKEYLKGKWSLIIIGISVSIVLSSFYLLISWEFYLTVFAAGLYNLGVNSYITLLAGAFNKKPIDLNSKSKSFGGGTNNFNMKTMLLTIPQMLLPMAVFAIVKYFLGIYPAVASLGILGIIGFMMRDKVFGYIVKVYKTQKYSTLDSFKNA
ncbi:DUF5687 family protein [Kaistella antarctica]|uniref:Uncharacterized protein n=1 Tax=Kaistella antarctica TaxID=266748 RepID=A0A3S4YL28_9FLAO|nr:DUF5687 family protein [Kaistella antarctica]KEY18146.1 hypothetical protein HY04_06390 [Kaistella antarctica]SEV83094.1 hypothetical protein SAMN05421765_0484 [Kaistella antarctica]VEI00738.1 Uncharacterised protein [Kaistella antarctica]